MFDGIHRLTPGAQRGDNLHVGFGIDPAPQQAAGNDRVIDDHDPDGSVGRGRRVCGGNGNTHGTVTFFTVTFAL